MSEFLSSLNATDTAPAQSWAAEVAAAEATAPAPEPVAAEPAPEPAKVAEAAPEPSQPAPEATEQDDRRVPLKALQEERQKRSEYERKLAEYERRFAELEQRVPKQAEAPVTPEPDPETDPIGALKHAREQLRQMQEVTRAQQYETELNTIAYNAAVQFKAQAPDYTDAYNYAIKSRAQELAIMGPPPDYPGTLEQFTRVEIPAILKREEMNLIDIAYRQGGNPAQRIYEFAKARGYAPKTAAPAPAPAPVPAAPSPALQQAKAEVAASASAGGAPAAKGEVTDTDLANATGTRFDTLWAKRFGGNRSSMFRE